MAETKNRLGVFSLAAGLTSAGLLLIVAVVALKLPGYRQLPAGLVIGAAVMMLGSVLSGLAALIVGVIGLFRPARKKLALAGAIIGGAAVAFLVLLVVIGERVGGPLPAPSPPALRPDTSAK